MADDLQHLIDRIQQDGVAKAEADAAAILAQAKTRAAEAVKAAEAEAQAIRKRAEAEARVFGERSAATLQQAARDLILAVGRGLERLLDEVAAQAVGKALDPDTLRAMLRAVAAAYAAKGLEEDRLTVLLSPEDRQRLGDAIQAELAAALRTGVEVQPDGRMLRGFALSVRGGRLVYDFSQAAIAEALGALLKPPLVELVQRAARDMAGTPG